ncbi:MAG: hypothetical protein K0S08_2182 [Gammaproteobacteria bacterium]|jgi:hypothetical protein|nr:hypothetical protein [Gammaproteobacteria bacterium]
MKLNEIDNDALTRIFDFLPRKALHNLARANRFFQQKVADYNKTWPYSQSTYQDDVSHPMLEYSHYVTYTSENYQNDIIKIQFSTPHHYDRYDGDLRSPEWNCTITINPKVWQSLDLDEKEKFNCVRYNKTYISSKPQAAEVIKLLKEKFYLSNLPEAVENFVNENTDQALKIRCS